MYYILHTIFWYLLTRRIGCSSDFLASLKVQSLPNFVDQPPLHLYALKDDQISIPCHFQCLNCTDKISVLWEKNDLDIHQSDLVFITNNNLTINSYQPQIHNGSYSCIVSYKGLSFRSASCNLHTAVLPTFTIGSQVVTERGSIVFLCADDNVEIKNHLTFVWIKNGDRLKSDIRFILGGNYLFIKRVYASDVGLYSCQYRWKKSNILHKSQDVFLNISSTSKLPPSITMLTPHKIASTNQTVTIACLANGPLNTIVRLLKLKADLEVKLSEQNQYIIHTWKYFNERDEGTYICESEVANIRRKKKMEIQFIENVEEFDYDITHINTKTGTQLSFSCEPVGINATTTWYHNALKIDSNDHWTFLGPWLTISKIDLQHAGIYQCIYTSKYNAHSRNFYLTVANSGIAPVNLMVEKLEPTKVKLMWMSPFDKAEKNIYYRLYWYEVNGHVWDDFTTDTEFLISHNLYGGMQYMFKVCTFYTLEPDTKDCLEISSTMLEAVPLSGPTLERPLHKTGQIVELQWKPIPPISAQGIIKNYTVFCQPLFGEKRNSEIYHFDHKRTKARIALKGHGTYKIWIVAQNNVGISPSSSAYIVSTKEKWNSDSPDMAVQIDWGNYFSKKKIAVLRWSMSNTNKTLKGYRIFYITVPYEDYWKSVTTVDVGRNDESYKVHGLSIETLYRFTIAPIYEWNSQFQQRRTWLGERTHIILHESFNLEKTFQSKVFNYGLVSYPTNLVCIGTQLHSLLISWNAPITNYLITNYIVKVKCEKTGVEYNYSTTDSHISIHNLTDVWHAVRVQADNYYLTNITFLEAGYIPCRTKVNAPTAPQSPQYSFLHHKSGDNSYIRIKWKTPLYSGSGIYSYNIRTLDTDMGLAPFPFEPNFYHVIMERQHDDWIRSPAIILQRGNIKVNIQITAINVAGEGLPARFMTEVSKPETHSTAVTHTTKTIPTSPVALGIIVGVAVSAIFVLVFIAVCILKDPCSSTCKHDSQHSEAYLYSLKLNEMKPSHPLLSQNKHGDKSSKITAIRSSGSSCCLENKFLDALRRPFKKYIRSDDGSSTITELLSRTRLCSCNNRSSLESSVRRSRHCPTCSGSLYTSSASEEKESLDIIPAHV